MKVGACVVIGAVGLGLAGLVSCGQPDRGKPADPAAMPARPVSVARAQTRAIARTIGATGSLAAQEQATLSAKVAGRLERLEVDIGSELRQGDLVAQIHAAPEGPGDLELAHGPALKLDEGDGAVFGFRGQQRAAAALFQSCSPGGFGCTRSCPGPYRN